MDMKLSNPRTELRDRYGIIVIGSGYGGSILAARLAAAGEDVCLLERGKEWIPGTFPDEPEEAIAQWRSEQNPLGLYEYCITDALDIFMGCGLGGTSLINANVLLKPDPDVFDHPRWPEEIRAARDNGTLDAYYARAFSMLQGAVYPDHWPSLRKVEAHQKSAQGRPGRFSKLDLAVNFTYDNAPNHVGVYQRQCILCGDCITGCNVRAKNTLYMNYLPFAKSHGAFICTGMEVHYISKVPDGGYFVHCISHTESDNLESGSRGPGSGLRAQNSGLKNSKVLHANVVILAAGTLGSNKILLQSRARGLALSDRLGHAFSANANTLGIGYNTDHRTDVLGFGNIRDQRSKIRVGPLIVSVIDYRRKDLPLPDRFIIEEGNFPRAFVDPLRFSMPKVSVLAGYDTDFGLLDELAEARRMLRDLASYDVDGALNHSMVYLGIGHDGADGVITLDAKGHIRIHWDALPSKPIFEKINNEMQQLVKALGGTYIRNLRSTEFFGNNMVTVHPLGGCAMGPNAEIGVVDHRGRVFDPSQGPTAVHQGLFVVDGSIMSTSLGENPMFTISALAERIADLLIQDTTIQKKPREGPLPSMRERVPPVGLEFTEELKGYVTDIVTTATTPAEYQVAEEEGKRQGKRLDVKLTMYIEDVNAFVLESTHTARAEGYVALDGSKYTVERGYFNLLITDPQTQTKQMRYSAYFLDDTGQDCFLEGYKEIQDDPAFDVWEIWKDTTTLFVTLYRGKSTADPVVGQGILRVHLQDFLKQLTTFRVRHAPNLKAQAHALTQFLSFFFGSLWETYVKPLMSEP